MEITPAAAVAENVAATCSLDNYLAQPDHTMDARIAGARATLGTDVVLLGHHYQRDEVIRFADFTGDSYKLSKVASETDAKYMLFCGVHFMAETADVLGRPWQQVILPDLNAGCSMADMAEIGQVEDCWDSLVRAGLTDEVAGGLIPLTYMNSAAAIKGFCGRHGGLVCTSSNARRAFEWAFARGEKISVSAGPASGAEHRVCDGDSVERDGRVGPVPDQWWPESGAVEGGKSGSVEGALLACISDFFPEHVDRVRREHPEMQVIVHPECRWEVCQKADAIGSTERIIEVIERAPEGSSFAVGTEIHLVNRLAKRFAPLGKRVMTLDDSGCLCTTMYRISPQHLAWALENLVEGRVVNRIKVEDDVKQWARVALDRMLEIRI